MLHGEAKNVLGTNAMKRFLAAIAVSCTAVLYAACGQSAEGDAVADTPAPAAVAVTSDAETTETAPVTPTPASTAGGVAISPDAPPFAVLYPGATLDAPAVTASSAAGPGGLATYTTEAGVDAVIAFHRAQAEAAGLSSAMAMNQGEARAYGAANPGSGASLQVVASATGADTTSVQISWSAGR